jgi:hypothetical protein
METKKVTSEMLAFLKAPLPEIAISQHPTKTYLSSIKAIFVTERLSDVFGIGSWHNKCEIIEKGEKGMVVVKVTLTIPEYGIELESFGGNDNGGENSKNFDLGDAYKGAVTDAITKIGSWLYIGIDVFKGQKKPNDTGTKKLNNLTPKKSESKELPEALEEIRKADTLASLQALWVSYNAFQTNPEFIAAKDLRKIELNKK